MIDMADPEIAAFRAKLASRRGRRIIGSGGSISMRSDVRSAFRPMSRSSRSAPTAYAPNGFRRRARPMTPRSCICMAAGMSSARSTAIGIWWPRPVGPPAAGPWRSIIGWRPNIRFRPRSMTRSPLSLSAGRGIKPGRIAIAGDSAGGGLVVAAMVAIRDAGLPQPGCGWCISPWVDMEAIGDTMTSKAGSRSDRAEGRHPRYGAALPGGADPRSPLAAPLYADLTRPRAAADPGRRRARRCSTTRSAWRGSRARRTCMSICRSGRK